MESKVKELESSIAEENSTTEDSTTDESTTDDSTTDESVSNEEQTRRPTVSADRGYSRRYNDSTTDDSTYNEEQNQNYERIERDLSKAQRAQGKANARKWSDRQRRR